MQCAHNKSTLSCNLHKSESALSSNRSDPINRKHFVVVVLLGHLLEMTRWQTLSFQISKYDFEDSIKREMSGDLRDGMLTIGNTFV